MSRKNCDIFVGIDFDFRARLPAARCNGRRWRFSRRRKSGRRRRWGRLLRLFCCGGLRRRCSVIPAYPFLIKHQDKQRQSDSYERAFFHVVKSVDRIVAAGAPRMAATQTAQRKKNPFKNSVLLHRLRGINRTGRVKTTGRRQPRGENLVISQQ